MTVRFGTLIKIDDATLNKKNLEFARILIKTSYPELLKTDWEVKVDDRIVKIRIVEDPISFRACGCNNNVGWPPAEGIQQSDQLRNQIEVEKSDKVHSNQFKRGELADSSSFEEVDESRCWVPLE